MFESAELGHTIDKAQYELAEPETRHALLQAQYELVKKPTFPVIILIGGVDGAGKGETLNMLNEWMDARHIQTNAMRPFDDTDGRPPMWRFWRVLPPKGQTAIFVGSWYTQPLLERAYRESKRAELDQALDEILAFEKMLTDEGAVLLKFWLHLSKQDQKKRFRALEKKKQTAWRVTETDWKHLELYDRFRKESEHALTRTSTAAAPWIVVEGADDRYRSLTIGKAILAALRERLDRDTPPPPSPSPLPARVEPIDGITVLDRLDMSPTLDEDEYDDQLAEQQGRINRLSRHRRFDKLSVVTVFEGVDAAGKGGAIRRLTHSLDARRYNVIPVGAPTDDEKARPYLWRFWRHIPDRGRVAVFDRSWYGRVLVERIEGFCTPADWQRAYGEINDFEAQLADNRAVVVKLWLQISKDEQLRRFKEREATPYKQHKITADDWRNREKWDSYRLAVCEMFDRTSTTAAPWTIVPANDKYFARVMVLRTIADAIEAAL